MLRNITSILWLVAINAAYITTTYAASDKIELYTLNSLGSESHYVFKSPFRKHINSYLKVGDTINAQIVKITSSSPNKFKVSVKFETSLTIMDEGPHLDLRGWKHCTSGWIDLKPLQHNKYQLQPPIPFDESCFPQVSAEEIRSEVQRIGGKEWSSLLKGEINVHHYPLGVSISSVKLRIQKEVNGILETVTIINFKVPMGC